MKYYSKEDVDVSLMALMCRVIKVAIPEKIQQEEVLGLIQIMFYHFEVTSLKDKK